MYRTMLKRLCTVVLLALAGLSCDTREPAAATQPTAPAAGLQGVIDLNGKPTDPFVGQDRATVLLFVTTDCPISNAYAPEVQRIFDQYGRQQVGVYLVYPDVDLKAADARKHYADFGYRCGALLDPKHELVKRAKATDTPEAVVFLPDGSVAYRGRINNLYADYGKARFAPTEHDLRDVLEAIVRGLPVTPRTTEVIGCPIPE
jgi:hypothetical protein